MTADFGFQLRAASKLGFLNDFEDYKHGIMSAFLLFKNLRTFQNIDYNKLKDELEEFSRISRASQNREYVKEFCTTEEYAAL